MTEESTNAFKIYVHQNVVLDTPLFLCTFHSLDPPTLPDAHHDYVCAITFISPLLPTCKVNNSYTKRPVSPSSLLVWYTFGGTPNLIGPAHWHYLYNLPISHMLVTSSMLLDWMRISRHPNWSNIWDEEWTYEGSLLVAYLFFTKLCVKCLKTKTLCLCSLAITTLLLFHMDSDSWTSQDRTSLRLYWQTI